MELAQQIGSFLKTQPPELTAIISKVQCAKNSFTNDSFSECKIELSEFVAYFLHQTEIKEEDIKFFRHAMSETPQRIDWDKEVLFYIDTYQIPINNLQRNHVKALKKQIGPHTIDCSLAKNLRSAENKEIFILDQLCKNKTLINVQLKLTPFKPDFLFQLLTYQILADSSLTAENKDDCLILLIEAHAKHFPEDPPFFEFLESPFTFEDPLLIANHYLILYKNNLDQQIQNSIMQNFEELALWTEEKENYFRLRNLIALLEKIPDQKNSTERIRFILGITQIISNLIGKSEIKLIQSVFEALELCDETDITNSIVANVLCMNPNDIPEEKYETALCLINLLIDLQNQATSENPVILKTIFSLMKKINELLIKKIKTFPSDKHLIAFSNIVIGFHEFYQKYHSNVSFTNIYCLFELYKKMKSRADFKPCFSPVINLLEYLIESTNLENPSSNTVEKEKEIKKKLDAIQDEYAEIQIEEAVNKLIKKPFCLSILGLENIKALMKKSSISKFLEKLNKTKKKSKQSAAQILLLIELYDDFYSSNLTEDNLKKRLQKIWPLGTPVEEIRKKSWMEDYQKKTNPSSFAKKTSATSSLKKLKSPKKQLISTVTNTLEKEENFSSPNNASIKLDLIPETSDLLNALPSSMEPDDPSLQKSKQYEKQDDSFTDHNFNDFTFDFETDLDNLYLYSSLNLRYLSGLKKLISRSFSQLENENFYKHLDQLIAIIKHFNDEEYALEIVEKGKKKVGYTQKKIDAFKAKLNLKNKHPQSTHQNSLENDLIESSVQKKLEEQEMKNQNERFKSFQKVALGDSSKIKDEDIRLYSPLVQAYYEGKYPFDTHTKMMNTLKKFVKPLGMEYVLVKYTGSHGKHRLVNEQANEIYGSATIRKNKKMSNASLIVYFEEALIYALKIKSLKDPNFNVIKFLKKLN